MALSRNARRLNAKKRATLRATDAANTAMVLARRDTERRNLSNPRRGSRSEAGLVSSIYSAVAKPVGYSRPMRWTKGAATDGTKSVNIR